MGTRTIRPSVLSEPRNEDANFEPYVISQTLLARIAAEIEEFSLSTLPGAQIGVARPASIGGAAERTKTIMGWLIRGPSSHDVKPIRSRDARYGRRLTSCEGSDQTRREGSIAASMPRSTQVEAGWRTREARDHDDSAAAALSA